MRAAAADQLRLLDVAALDAAAARAQHRRRTLPELEQAASLGLRADELADDIVRAETDDSDLRRDQEKVDADVELVRSRMQRDQQRLDTGAVGSPRELSTLQSEIESLHRRQTELEDAELEVMEQRETVQARLAELRSTREEVAGTLASVERSRDAALADVDAELETTAARRTEAAQPLPADLLALYEKLRASTGVGAAALHRGRCEGCHLQLDTTALNALRAADPDDVVRCEECRRILVRTDESGL